MLAAAFGLTSTTTATAQETFDWSGAWHGTIEAPTGDVRVGFNFSTDGTGALEGAIESPDQAPGEFFALEEITVDGNAIVFEVPVIGAAYEGVWDARTDTISGTFRQSGMDMPLTLEPGTLPDLASYPQLDGTWEGVLDSGAGSRVILRVMTHEGGTRADVDAPEALVYGAVVADLALEGDTLSFRLPALSAAVVAALDGGTLTGEWVTEGVEEPAALTLERTSDSGERPQPDRPQEPQEPFPYVSEDVTFDNPQAEDVTLAGTLSLPEGDGPFPAVILISGSGPQDRDSQLFGHRPFLVLADHLTRNGIAVLRHDDRGVGESSGSHAGTTSADFATDTLAALAFLQTRPEIDAERIGLIGHSEGGIIAPMALGASDAFAFAVLMAAPGVDGASLLRAQRRAIGEAQGESQASIASGQALQDAMFSAVAEGESSEAVAALLAERLTDEVMTEAGVPVSQRDALIAQITEPWFLAFLAIDPAPLLAAINVPVLAINGTHDTQVPYAENLAAIGAALAGNSDVTLVELDGLNHLFQTAPTGHPGEYQDLTETFAPEALEVITAWILARFG